MSSNNTLNKSFWSELNQCGHTSRQHHLIFNMSLISDQMGKNKSKNEKEKEKENMGLINSSLADESAFSVLHKVKLYQRY